MADKYTGKISRNTDWGGDASTGFLPVAGSSVQAFIKDELKTKIGAVYKPDGSNFVYYFANEEDKNAYIESGDESYILDSFEMASKYDVRIDPETLVLSHSVIDGTTGNTAFFKFKIVDDNDMTADAKARIEFSFTGSGISNKFTKEIAVNAGDWTQVSENIDNYLRSGSNSLAIKITGLSTQASTQFVMTYNLFDLMFVPSFEYNVAQNGNTISVPYIIECSDTKYLEFFIDGRKVDSAESMVIPDIRMDSRATLNIASLAPGQHTLQVRAYVKSNDGTLFYTPLYYYTFAKAGQSNPAFLMYMQLPNTTSIFEHEEDFTIPTKQFGQITFDWAMYDYALRKLNVRFEYEGISIANVVVDENGKVNTFSYRPMDFGEGKTLRVYALGEEEEIIFEHEINVDVEEATGGIKETTDGMLIKLQATGRRNTDDNKDVWECVGTDGNTYAATFNGFAWNSQQGWDEETESLVISNGATVSFNIQPMKWDWAQQGGTVEIDLETFDIENEDAVICECANNLGQDDAFFRVTATKAEFSTASHVSINTRYKDNERLKIAFIGNRAGSHDDGYLIYIVINGVLERAALYKDGDSMYSFANLSIGNPDGECKVRLRSIRVYDRAITVDQAFNNYVVDSDNVQEIYEKNNVLKEGSSTEIGFDEVANKLPVMIFTGDMDDIVTHGQDKEWRRFDVEYINRQEPERNFVSFNCRMKLQGTSSLGYPRKNFKLNTKDKYFVDDVYTTSKYELDPNSVVGNLMLRNKITGEQIDFDDFKTGGRLNNSYCFTLDYQGKPLKKGKYRFRKNAHKAQKWTLKADFMESSCSHNVAAGRSWNDIFENTPLLANGDASYINQTYKDSALVTQAEYIDYDDYNIEGEATHYHIENNTDGLRRQKDYVCRTDAQKRCISAEQDDVRTAIDGFPMVCFYRTSHAANDLVFIGQYNFINDKGSYEVFGFEDIEDPNDDETMIYDATKVECWEGLKNTNPLSLFKTIEGFYDWNSDGTLRKWAETYGARYPDPDDYEPNPECLYELSKWLVSTRHVSGETQYSGTLDIDASFAKRINTYQYGYTDDTATGYTYAEGTNLEDNAENRQKKFETEKWEHFDVWKLAGYYVYLRRYGAVDQFVKNTMLFTDGNGRYDPRTDIKYRKWFFINYDNDCLFGLRNNGQLAFHWDLDRQTIDSASDIIDDGQDEESGTTNSYAMMGHDSTLWNNLEADDEFMRMVRDLDYSMTKYKLNYDNMVKEFDTDQTEQWCERIYNANERYKYINAAKGIGDMAGKAVNNLWMLQGTRRSHRHWWIANHFNLLDAQWLSGDYKGTYVEIKTNCPAGVSTRAKAGAKYFYAWGQQKRIYESNMVRNEGEDIVFTFDTAQSQGDPVYIYAFNKMTELDFSALAKDVFEGSFKFVLGNGLVQNTMKKLVVGNPLIRNNTAQDTTTWGECLPNLEYIDITNYEGITSVPLKAFNNLHTFKAAGTRLGAFNPAEGSVFDLVELPSSIKTLNLTDVSFNHGIFNDFKYTVNTNLDSLTIANNAGVQRPYYDKIIKPWIDAIEASAQPIPLYMGKSLVLKNVNWSFDNLDYIRLFKNIKTYARTFQISGVIDLRSCGNLSMANIDEVKSIFGENCFNEKLSPLYVITPESVFIGSERTSMVAGESNVFTREIYPDERAVEEDLLGIYYYIVEETEIKKEEKLPEQIIFEDIISGKNYLVINDVAGIRQGLRLTNTRDTNNKQIGILSCEEHVVDEDTTVKVLVHMDIRNAGTDKISLMDFTIKDPTYVHHGSISGSKSLYRNSEYVFTFEPKTEDGNVPIGSYTVNWELSGASVSDYIESAQKDDNNQLRFIIRTNQDQPEISSKMVLTASIVNHDGTECETSVNVLALNETVIMTSDSNPVVMEIAFNEGWAEDRDAMTKAQAAAVSGVSTVFKGIETSFSFPELVYFTGLTELEEGAFSASNITEIVFPNTITSIGAKCFDGCSALTEVAVEVEGRDTNASRVKMLPPITVLNEATFRGCTALNELTLPEGLTTIDNFVFGNTGFRSILLPSSEIYAGALRLSSTVTTINGSAFETSTWTPETTTNPITHFEIPTALTLTNYMLLRGKYIEDFVVEEGHNRYALSDEGVLLSRNGDTLLRYPPMAAQRDLYQIPNVQYISAYAFFGVKNLNTIVVPEGNSVQIIQEGFCMNSNIVVADLSNCNYLSNGELPSYAFAGCEYLENIYLPNDAIRKIGVHAFENCLMLESLTIPSSVEEFLTVKKQSYAISNCPKLTSLVFPNSVTKMGAFTVNNCSGITDVVLPAYLDYSQYRTETGEVNPHDFDGILVDGFGILNGCPNITGLTLPAFSIDVFDETLQENVSKTINRPVFYYNGWINDIGENSGTTSWGIFDGFPLLSAGKIGYWDPEAEDGKGNKGVYVSLFEEGEFNTMQFRLPNEDNGAEYISVNGILYSADKTYLLRAPLKGFTTVHLPLTITRIGNRCFRRSSIETLVCPENLKTIEGQAFQGSQLREITLNEGLEVIESYAFSYCNQLAMRKLVLPKTLRVIGDYGFGMQNCFEEIEINSNVRIGVSAFSRDGGILENFSKLVIKGNPYLDYFAFRGCKYLATMVISSEFAPIIGGGIAFSAFLVDGGKTGDGVPAEDRKIYISVGKKSEFMDSADWNYIVTVAEYQLIEEIPLTGYGRLTLYVEGQPYENIVYATSSLGHLVGDGGGVYTSTYSNGHYLFELDGLYDGEEITLYSDAECTNEIGSFIPKLDVTEYESGELSVSMSMSKGRSMILGAPKDETIVSLTKSEYDELTSKVNQMMRIINKLVK